MKKLLSLIIISITLYGCTHTEGSIDYDYTIVNNSGKTVTIIPYVNGIKDLQNIITLNQGGKINKKYTYLPPGGAGFSMAELLPNNSGYVALVYDNAKINLLSIYSEQCTTCPTILNNSFPIFYNENSRNIFNPIYSNEQTETYTITPEDFQNATDCNGNCN